MSNGIDLITLALARKGGGGGGTSDYARLSNLPKINGTTITGNLDADALGLANCKYYTLVVDETNRFVDADGTELAIADVYRDMAQFVSEDKSNIAVINVTFADDEEETGHTITLIKLFFSAIDTEEGGFQFYAKAGPVEFTSLVTEDEVTFKMRDVDFVIHGILTMTSETSATISDLTADYEAIMEAIDNGSNVKLAVVVYSSLAPEENGTIFELNHVIYNKNLNIIEFEGLLSDRLFQVIIENSSQDVIITSIQAKPTVTTQTAPTSISIEDNSEYYLTNVSSCAFSYPTGNFECWMRLTTATSGTVTITLPTSQYIGDAPSFGNGETWEISIKDGVVASAKVGA